jgi:hypothetical protein
LEEEIPARGLAGTFVREENKDNAETPRTLSNRREEKKTHRREHRERKRAKPWGERLEREGGEGLASKR